MRKLITFVLISSILSITSITAFAQSSASKPYLTINTISQPPFTTKDKDGFLDLLLAEAFKRVGVSFKIVNLPAERGLIAANDDIIDGDLPRIKGLSKNYKNLIMVPEKVRDTDFCALSKNPDISAKPDELIKHVIGYIKGWKIYDKMMAGSKRVITADSAKQLFRLLKLNRIDVALYNCINGIVVSNKMGIQGVKILQPAFPKGKMYLYLNKKHIKLVPQISKALHEIKAEGIYKSLYRKKIMPKLKTKN